MVIFGAILGPNLEEESRGIRRNVHEAVQGRRAGNVAPIVLLDRGSGLHHRARHSAAPGEDQRQ